MDYFTATEDSAKPEGRLARRVAQRFLEAVIRKEKGLYCVRSPNNPDWNGGCYPSKQKARDRLKQVEFFKRQGSQHPQLYRGVSPSVKYTGYNWHANVYLTDDLESAAIYGRFGETYRAQVPDLIVMKADDDRVRDIEGSAHPEKRAMELGIQAVWNDSSFKVGKVFPHEFIVFDPHTQTSFSALTKPEQIKANRIKEIFKENPR